MRILLIATLLFTTAFAQTKENKPNPDRAAVDKISRAFEAAAAKKDAVAIGQMYHSQAHLLGGNMPAALGRDQIQKIWQGFFDANFTGLQLHTESVERQGEVLVELGHYSATIGGKPENGKYVVLYKKERGAWKLWVDSFSSDAAPAP